MQINSRLRYWLLDEVLMWNAEILGALRSTKNLYWNFGNSQRKGTFRLNRPDPSHRVFGYCTRKQDIEERYRGQQLLSNGEGHFGQSAWTTFKGQVPNIPVERYRNGPLYLIPDKHFRNFEPNGKRPVYYDFLPCKCTIEPNKALFS